MILGENSERRDQSSFSCLENINFWKFLSRAPEFKYPPLVSTIPKNLVSNFFFRELCQIKKEQILFIQTDVYSIAQLLHP